MKVESSRQGFEKIFSITFNENSSSVSRVFTCGQTDTTKLTAALRNFANAPKNLAPTHRKHSVAINTNNPLTLSHKTTGSIIDTQIYWSYGTSSELSQWTQLTISRRYDTLGIKWNLAHWSRHGNDTLATGRYDTMSGRQAVSSKAQSYTNRHWCTIFTEGVSRLCNAVLGYLGKREEANITHVELVVEYTILYGWKISWLSNNEQNKSSVGKDRERIKRVSKRYCCVFPYVYHWNIT